MLIPAYLQLMPANFLLLNFLKFVVPTKNSANINHRIDFFKQPMQAFLNSQLLS
jgi:hypothetical protein